MSKRPVPISRLAYYAADPATYVEKAGGAANARAAEYGEAAHRRAVRKPTRLRTALAYGLALLAALALAYAVLVL